MTGGPFSADGVEVKKTGADQKRISQYVPDLFRLELIKEIFVKDELPSRGTRDTHFVEAWLEAVETGGIKLTAARLFVRMNRERSPHEQGKQIDAIVKMLSAGPTYVSLGTPYDEKEPGMLATIIDKIKGRSSE
jgi:hypothetical protein